MIAREMAADPKANHYTKVLTITLVFVIIAFAEVTSRLVSKRMKHTSIAIDDYLLIFAFVSSLWYKIVGTSDKGIDTLSCRISLDCLG